MANILIAGCGDIGSRLAEKFIELDHTVTAIRHRGTAFPKGAIGVTQDLTTMTDDRLPEVDLVCLIMTPKGRTEEAYTKAYWRTAQRLVDRYASHDKTPKVFFVSSTSVYGQNSGEELDEESITLPQSATAKVLIEVERLLNEHFSSTSVRFSGIYGPGRLRLIESLAKSEPWNANQWTNRVHRDDCVNILAFLAEKVFSGVRVEPVYIGTDCNPVSQWEVKLWLSNQLHVKPNLPDELGVESFLPVSGKQLSNARLLRLGYEFLYPSYLSGYRGLLEEHKANVSYS